MLLKFFLKTVGNLLFSLGIGTIIFTYIPILYSEVHYSLFLKGKDLSDHQQVIEEKVERPTIPDSENILPLQPANPDFSIMINKIAINAPIVQDVTTIKQSSYLAALREGVAHAQGTALPGEAGNMFLFAHSSLNFWELGPYATVFNLLNKLEKGDTVIVYYKGSPYLYKVSEIDIVSGWNTEPFYNEYDKPVLTMITCDPVGTTINRRVVTAELLQAPRKK